MIVSDDRKKRLEFGDFQTPDDLALDVCQYLARMKISPDILIEPTCGIGSFIIAGANTFPLNTSIYGYDINQHHLDVLHKKLAHVPNGNRVYLERKDFFNTNWDEKFSCFDGSILVVGNFPWVTNSKQGEISSKNIPEKSNFKKCNGLDSITGQANFDISEWMFLHLIKCFVSNNKVGNIAMLVKTSVSRKILSYINKENIPVSDAFLIKIDAKKHFYAAVDACLLVVRLERNTSTNNNYDYTVFNDFSDTKGIRIGHRSNVTVSNLNTFDKLSFLVGKSPQKWRSGVKHDAASIMEFSLTNEGLINKLGEIVDIEFEYLFPLLKGSDVGNEKTWRKKYILITQKCVGQQTDDIQKNAPKTWRYLLHHSGILSARKSSIYNNKPKFSVFGIGDYAFRPWKIAICGLYKKLAFRLVGPIEKTPVMFDDTVYYISFDNEKEAKEIMEKLDSKQSIELLSSLIFWDEKRPIKANILNMLDWNKAP